MASHSVRNPSRLIVVAALSIASLASSALSFLSPTSVAPTLSYHAPATRSDEITSLFMASKKRRRRKDSPASTPDSPPASDSPAPTMANDELPDFDFDDGTGDMVAAAPAKVASDAAPKAAAAEKPRPVSPPPVARSTANATPVKRGTGLSAVLAEELGGNVDGLDEDVILSSMGGKAGGASWQPPKSVDDTISDRGLEKFMNFDKMIEQDGRSEAPIDLPTMDEVISRRKKREKAAGNVIEGGYVDTDGMGKKAAKKAQRKAAALQEEEMELAEASPFADALKDLNGVELLSKGAWAGIALLILWEFYINSPWFDRAMPLIPAVFE